MSDEPSLEAQFVAQLWTERFGQPPPILTDVELMWRVLESLSGLRPHEEIAH